ncbi:MAG: hypothetical protein OXI87_05060, partial [Albidovulum sp.]|nr:hypothetical protein [Albidovulum sp.]
MKMRLLWIGDIVRDGLFNAFRYIDAALKTSVFFEAPGSGFPAPRTRPEAAAQGGRHRMRLQGQSFMRRGRPRSAQAGRGRADPALSERGQPDRADEAAEPPLAAQAAQAGVPVDLDLLEA